MKNAMKYALAAAVSLVALEASAGGFAVREQSATLQGFSFAGAATSAGGLSGMYWNPSVITEIPGINIDSHTSVILGYSKITPTTGSGPLVANQPGSGNIGIPALVGSNYVNYQVNDRLFLGLSVNAPYGLKTKSEYGWAGQLYGRSSAAFNMVATPTIGYRVNDWLSVGAGIQIGYMDVKLKQATGFPLAAPSAILGGDAWGVGYTLGATIKPMAGTEIGIGFRSSVRYALEGSLDLPVPVSFPIKAAVNLPETLTIGLKQKMGDNFTFVAGAEWSNWSRVRNAPIRNTANGLVINSLPFFYDDGWMFSVGGEYKYNQNLLLRAGLGYEISPVNDRVRSVRIPDNDRVWASIGASYKWNDKVTFDASYTHIFVKDPDVSIISPPGTTAHPHFISPAVQLVGKGKSHVDILSVSLRYHWDNPPSRSSVITKG